MVNTPGKTMFPPMRPLSEPFVERIKWVLSCNGSNAAEMPRRVVEQIHSKRRQLLLAAAATVVPRFSMAAQRDRIPRIAFLSATTPQRHAPHIEALRSGLHELGYIEGQNIAIDYRWAEDNRKRLPKLAAELVQLQPDVIVTGGARAIRAVKKATTAIPIVMAVVGDPVASGLVGSLARPGGNITGSTYFFHELSAKRLEILRDALPKLKRVAVLQYWASSKAGSRIATERAAGVLKLSLQFFAGQSSTELESAFAAMSEAGMEAVAVLDAPGMTSNAERIAQLAAAARLPTIGFKEIATAGGLLGYGVDFLAMYRRAAFFVDKILKGTDPGEIPIERATRFEFVVNLKTASALGITMPPVIMVRATQVIQ